VLAGVQEGQRCTSDTSTRACDMSATSGRRVFTLMAARHRRASTIRRKRTMQGILPPHRDDAHAAFVTAHEAHPHSPPMSSPYHHRHHRPQRTLRRSTLRRRLPLDQKAISTMSPVMDYRTEERLGAREFACLRSAHSRSASTEPDVAGGRREPSERLQENHREQAPA
jgi:hypothetical protein